MYIRNHIPVSSSWLTLRREKSVRAFAQTWPPTRAACRSSYTVVIVIVITDLLLILLPFLCVAKFFAFYSICRELLQLIFAFRRVFAFICQQLCLSAATPSVHFESLALHIPTYHICMYGMYEWMYKLHTTVHKCARVRVCSTECRHSLSWYSTDVLQRSLLALQSTPTHWPTPHLTNTHTHTFYMWAGAALLLIWWMLLSLCLSLLLLLLLCLIQLARCAEVQLSVVTANPPQSNSLSCSNFTRSSRIREQQPAGIGRISVLSSCFYRYSY